ncbi:TlpA disulfide reductase family protein [uncultured Algibacter sp.]|uniref:TlpA family protein disulfide reductase n=1 Tax=uncultured Algibacter sp. TaxID=298659 RepID=UPI002608F511|nr:TlpA disulfide reductase family protein [uncultured Algibacter sp.]
MSIKKRVIYLLCFLFPIFFFGQIKISEHIQESQIAKGNNNALYFVEFWATWCKPCIHVSKYLESLQSQYPNNFYVLSLTQENADVVKRFMKKHKMNLAVAIDFEGETFKHNNIQSLPQGILFNANGKKLWEGHPADFKNYHIRKFLNSNSKKISKEKMFKLNSYVKEVVKVKESPKKDFSITKLQSTEHRNEFQIIKHSSYLELKGNLQDILAYSLNVYRNQIKIPSELNNFYQVQFNLDSSAYSNKSNTILDALNLGHVSIETAGEALVFDIESPRFWNTNQIDWGVETPHFLIGDSEIQADNVSLQDVSYRLANLLNTPIVIENSKFVTELHDWQIHYKYFDLMVSNMIDNYGISIAKKNVSYQQYEIKKRTP